MAFTARPTPALGLGVRAQHARVLRPIKGELSTSRAPCSPSVADLHHLTQCRPHLGAERCRRSQLAPPRTGDLGPSHRREKFPHAVLSLSRPSRHWWSTGAPPSLEGRAVHRGLPSPAKNLVISPTSRCRWAPPRVSLDLLSLLPISVDPVAVPIAGTANG
jgi:hypothetical protein